MDQSVSITSQLLHMIQRCVVVSSCLYFLLFLDLTLTFTVLGMFQTVG